MRNYNIFEEDLKNFYFKENVSLETIAKNYKVSRSTISRLFDKFNIVRKNDSEAKAHHEFDRRYFQNIDTEGKAYFLGFMYADGCVHHNNNTVSLAIKDKSILELFQKQLNTLKPIYEINPNDKKYYMYSLKFRSDEMQQDLINKGCPSRKTFTLKFPTDEQVPKHLIHHFIRGYFDGDGTVGNYLINGNRVLTSRFAGTENMINGIKNLLNIVSCIYKSEKTYTLHFQQNNCLLLYEIMYKNATLFLARKKSIFENYTKISRVETPILASLYSTGEIIGLYRNRRHAIKELHVGNKTIGLILNNQLNHIRDFKFEYLYPETLIREFLIRN